MAGIIRRSYRFIRDIVLYLISLLIGGLYVLTCLAPFISPQSFILPALLTLFFGYILLGQIILFVYWLIRKRWQIILSYLLVFLLSSPILLDFCPIHFTSKEKNKNNKTIKVLSYNTFVFGYQAHSKDKPNPILKYIQESNADLVCLQEASYTVRVGSCINREKLHNYLKGSYPYINEQVAQNDGSMIILLSKYPIKKGERLPIKSRANGAVAWQVDIQGKEVLVVGVHLESFRLSKKHAEQYMAYVKKGNTLGLKYAVRGKIKPTLIAHAVQAKQIHKFIQESEQKNIIVCGDFNDTAISYAHNEIAKDLNDAYSNRGLGLGLSIRTSIFAGRIDHILYSDSFEALNCKVDRSIKASDHAPIITSLVWSDNKQQ